MIKQLLQKYTSIDSSDLINSKLYNEATFYLAFIKDIAKCRSELIIESPSATNKRISLLLPTLEKLKRKGVRIVINTKDPNENNDYLSLEATQSLAELQHLGIQVIYTENHHRKLAIIDREILWEGSLNILSHNRSKEVMRRTMSTSLSWQMVRFVGVVKDPFLRTLL